MYEDDDIAQYLALIEGEEKSASAARASDDTMETDEEPKEPAADPEVGGPETMDQGQ